MQRRILYIQFGDPAGYPPIEHSARLLADRGWDILLIGTSTFGDQKFEFPPHDRIVLKRIRFVTGGLRQKLLYVYFFLWSLYWTLRWQPRWIYASDPLACPIVQLIQKFVDVRVLYHEHDSPDVKGASTFMKAVYGCRKTLGRDATICVLPQQERLDGFVKLTRRTRPTFCVWNCPRLDEIIESDGRNNTRLVVYYHGSITPSRLPRSLIVAVSRFRGAVQLQIAGFEVIGAIGYLGELMKLAKECGVEGIFEPLGQLTPRKNLFQAVSRADVGLALMPTYAEDQNLRQMVGASNKAFDYMACGLPLLVTDLPEWISTFVEPGYARECDPNQVTSIEAALRWYLEHPDQRAEMGRRCREKIRNSWNYNMMFADVINAIETT